MHYFCPWCNQPRYNPESNVGDSFLRRLERERNFSPEANFRYLLELHRRKPDEYLANFNDLALLDIAQLNQHLQPSNYICQESDRSTVPIIISPEPPPPNQFLQAITRLVANDQYYISEEGEFGTPYSELAMYVGATGNQIERFLLLSQQRNLELGANGRVTWASIKYDQNGRSVIADGLPSEVLSDEIRRKLGFSDPLIPKPGNLHYPLIVYGATIVGAGDSIIRARINLFYYPHQAYWRLEATNWDYRVLEQIVSRAWPNYLEAYEP